MDARGTLLTKNFDDDEQMQMSTNEEMRRDYERRLISAVQSLIEQSVGQEKVRVQASLEMDFDQVVVNREIYDPEAQVLRSSTTIEESSQTDEREPIVSVEQNLPDAETQNANQVKQQANRTEETVNYEISKEVISQVRKNGVIKRLSVAVIVDGTYTLNPNGTKTYVPRTEKEMELLTTLVRSAVGYDANRGDTVEVINLPFFNPDDLLRLEDPILFMGFTKQEIMKMVEGLGPSDDLQQLPSPSSGGVLTETDQLEELIDIAKVEGRVKASSVRKIGEIIDQHPEEAVSIIRSWMYSDE